MNKMNKKYKPTTFYCTHCPEDIMEVYNVGQYTHFVSKRNETDVVCIVLTKEEIPHLVTRLMTIFEEQE